MSTIRRRKPPPKRAIAFNATEEYREAIQTMARDGGFTSVTMLALAAIREYAERRNIALPPRLKVPDHYRE